VKGGHRVGHDLGSTDKLNVSAFIRRVATHLGKASATVDRDRTDARDGRAAAGFGARGTLGRAVLL
jgi:hypothetical protein